MMKPDEPPNTPSFKNQRYDRQLRMWGDHGQRELENSHVCLVNATTTGCELLKSLILPGIGAYTVVDHRPVTGSDVGVNYFFQPGDIGKNRAKTASKNLNELNQLVKYHSIEIDAEISLDFLQHDFTIVIASDISDAACAKISDILYPRRIPFLVIENHGLIGYTRVETPSAIILESHPENPTYDLRLDRSFLELVDHINAIDLSKLTHQQHSHIPYLIILFKALQQWRVEKQRASEDIPHNFAETKELKEIINRMRIRDENGVHNEQNFDEATNQARLIHPSKIPDDLMELFKAPELESLDKNADKMFWIQIAALREFTRQNNGLLPLCATLPDMFSDSESYIKLSNIYKQRAHTDAERVHAIIADLVSKLGLERPSFDETAKLCKHSRELSIQRGHQFAQTSNPRNIVDYERLLKNAVNEYSSTCEQLNPELEAPPMPPPFFHYLALRARRMTDDEKNMASAVESFTSNKGLKAAAENMLCVFGKEHAGAAAVLGGVGAHECVKLLTRQYTPLNNTLLLDCHTGNSVAFKS